MKNVSFFNLALNKYFLDMIGMILVILGLCLFETINSIDNAIINAD